MTWKQAIKCLKKKVLSFNLNEKSFGIEPELTIKLAKKNVNFLRFQLATMEEIMMRKKKLN